MKVIADQNKKLFEHNGNRKIAHLPSLLTSSLTKKEL